MTHAAAVSRLRQLLTDVEARFGTAIDAEQEDDEWWTVQPLRPDSVGVTWHFEGDGGIDLQVLTESALGGQWELRNIDEGDLSWVEDMVWSVAAGRVEELLGPGRTTLRITLADGSAVEETGSGLVGLIPVPGWRGRADRKQYLPWSEPS